VNAVESRPLGKAEWRSQFKSRLNGFLDSDRKAEWDLAIRTRIRELLPPQGGYIAAYIARADEPQIHDLSKHDPQWQWVFPKVTEAGLQFFQPESPAAIRAGTMGLFEPDPALSKEVSLRECAVVLVPGIGFDRRGTRLGRGLGHFDKALMEFSGLRVGVAYSVQVASEDIAREPHDVVMDCIVTEKYLLRVKG
jgi:5-formyltetrahydrofolate cyclo-ligase